MDSGGGGGGRGGGGGGGGAKEGARPSTVEEEAQKRSTDCVYFLASPLTCKKGSECEYRHSEGARVNPRDCWYWLNGTCLNPKCSFRHPPLSLFGATVASVPAQPPATQASKPAQIPAPVPAYNMTKQSVPCYYFQKGNCLKGDKCPFMHGPQSAGAPLPEKATKVSNSHIQPPQTKNKDSWTMKDCKQKNRPNFQKTPPSASAANTIISAPKPLAVPSTSAKPVTKVHSAPSNVLPLKKTAVDGHPRFNQIHLPVEGGSVQNWMQKYEVKPIDDWLQNGSRHADEVLRESSPGFDVLVDNDDEDPEYLHNQDDFGRISSGRYLDALDNYEDRHTDDDRVLASFERDRYHGRGEPDWLGEVQNGYGLEQRLRSLAERISDRPGGLLQQEGESDLREKLLKRRRLNGLRSTINPDSWSEKPYSRDDNYVGEKQHSSISNRLSGRIRFPGGSSPNRVNLRREKEEVRGLRGRLSPVKATEIHTRHEERRRRKSNEDFPTGLRSFVGRISRSRDVVPSSLDFAGPKSLTELKGSKVTETKPAKVESEVSLSFEGPKPLSAILKRKRGAHSGDNLQTSNKKEDSDRDVEVGLQSITSTVEENGNNIVSKFEKDNARLNEGDEEEAKGVVAAAGEDFVYDNQELDHENARDGEPDYGFEAAEEEENAYQEDDDGLDDDDDFTKKVNGMFS
ncbi:Zinc finger CCCH domain-containing protein 32 [Ananas comosus]|uniref:Zinc finger CCCH domain-containing protein 32 n=1 Tax=Ananas comosus TaxID=4615 RepID=A0A199VF40_ANACO|nr:Zinc finger CCCH domain-containing protein 32 [Ananas comosus]